MQQFYDYQVLGLKKIVFQNASAIILGRMANLVFSIISSVLLVRYLGSVGLGQYASVYAYLTLFNWLTTLGMEYIIVRDTAKQENQDTQQLFGTATTVSFIFSLIAAMLAMAGSMVFGYGAHFQTLLFIAAIDTLLLSPLRLSSSAIFQVRLKFWYGTIISFFRQVLWVIIMAALILTKANLSAIICGRLFCSIVEAITFFLFARRFLPFKWHFSGSAALNILKHSWPLALSALCASIYQRIDQVMLHTLAGNQKLGHYAAAVNIFELFSIFSVAIMAPMFPILSEAILDKKRFEYYCGICFRYLMSFIFGICAIITITSPLIIRILYGGNFVLSGGILAILIWAQAGVFFGTIMGNILTTQGLQKFILLTTFMGAVINIILNMILIPKWGGIGAAWASVISYNSAGFFLFLIFPATRDAWFMGLKASSKPFFIGLFIVIILSTVAKALRPLILIPIVLLISILYVGGLFIFKAWNKDDMRNILNILFVTKSK